MGDFKWDLDDPAGYANTMGRYKTDRERAFIERHLDPGPLNVLDIGGGGGRFAGPLGAAGHRVTVSERSAQATELLRARAYPGVTAAIGDFMAFSPSPAEFDLALAMESLLYFDHVELIDVYRHVGDLLRPGGCFVFTMLNGRGWRSRARRLLGRGDYTNADPATTTADLDRAGFTVTAMEGLMWLPVSVTSDSPVVPALARVEHALGLPRWIDRSPWYLVAARRR